MTERTSGPWTVDIIDKGRDAHILGAPNGFCCDIVGTVDLTSPEGEANAFLIAAAPMLLEGAQDSIEALKLLRLGLANGITDEPKMIELLDAHIDELSFAIATATGIPT